MELAIGQLVGPETRSAACCVILEIKDFTAFAGPAFLCSGDAKDESKGRDIFGNDCPCTDQGVFPNGDAGDDGGVGPNTGPALDEGGTIIAGGVIAGMGATRGLDVGKDHARATEDVVFKGYTGIDGDVVLYFAVVTNFNASSDEAILSDGAIFPDLGVFHNVAEMPDRGAIANSRCGVNTGSLVDFGHG